MDSPAVMEKVQALQARAVALGFDGFGIARPDIPAAVEKYQQWLRLEYAGEMAYMRRWEEKRSDLNHVLPGVQSVICLRKNYFTRERDMTFLEHPDEADISHYALNEDYHDVMLPRLKQLEDAVHQEFAGCNSKVYVDTGPVLEKPLAEQAGIGWIGKHSNLISEGIGSWYFLAEILLDVWLPENQPAVDRCGTCQDCIDICPTQAIVAPYVVDSRRCISYLTIELKGVIPIEFRRAMGNRIYGCDDCQIVCPWNSYAVQTEESAFYEQESTRRLIDLMRLDDKSFRERFRHSPIKRIKRRGLLRNVAVALGNSGSPEAVPPLIDALRDSEPLIRAHAVWALGELLQAKALPILREKLASETDDRVLEEIRTIEKMFDLSKGSDFSR